MHTCGHERGSKQPAPAVWQHRCQQCQIQTSMSGPSRGWPSAVPCIMLIAVAAAVFASCRDSLGLARIMTWTEEVCANRIQVGSWRRGMPGKTSHLCCR